MPNLTAILSEATPIIVVVNTQLFRRARRSEEVEEAEEAPWEKPLTTHHSPLTTHHSPLATHL